MATKVLIVPDKFKGTLTAAQAAEAIEAGWREVRPQDALDLLPMTDGGDGFGEVMGQLFEAEAKSAEAVDAAHRPCEAPWWWNAKGKTGIAESAKVVGLAQLPPGKYHPFELDTYGLGVLLQKILEHTAQRCLIGIGGSATNDAGFGLARALGWQFFNDRGEDLQRWTELHALSQVRVPLKPIPKIEVIGAVDVQNPLLGPEGATRAYGPQKGLTPRDFEFADRCFQNLVEILEKELHINYSAAAGAGAAGGLGFGLLSFLGATLKSGFEIFSEASRLEERISGADLVITAEGRLDPTSFMGKGVGEIARLARKHEIPCLAFTGEVVRTLEIDSAFTTISAIAEIASAGEAKSQAASWLSKIAAKTATSHGTAAH